MIRCPECGESAQDDAKFCDRCGQSLTSTGAAAEPASRPALLRIGTLLKGGFEISETLPGTSIENRYRVLQTIEGKGAHFIIRERYADEREQSVEEPAATIVAETPAPQADPNGPTAKTAELKLPPLPQAHGQGAGLEEAASEPAATQSEPAEAMEPPPAASNGANALPEPGASLDTPAEEPSDPKSEVQAGPAQDDLGEVFGRVLAMSLTLTHPGFQRAVAGFAENGCVYLVYPDEKLIGAGNRSIKLGESETISSAIQVCQAVSFVHRRGLRLNDICPQSVARTESGRIKLTGLDYVSNDNELQSEPIFNDGYTAPEIYRGKKVDKRADVFSAGALLYTWLTGERLESESWREEAGTVRFYPPHVVTPDLEQTVRRALLFDPKDRWATIDEFKTELTKLLAEVEVSAAVLTDVGMVRDHNEDVVMALQYTRDSLVEPAQNYLYAVCDGMGGAEAGEVASAIAVGAIRRYVQDRLAGAEANDLCKLMTSSLEEANSKIIEYQVAHPESRGMGSTGVVVFIKPPEAALAWVGDSRAYVLESGNLRQVTKDHSLVARLVEIGQITEEQAASRHKNVITLWVRPDGPRELRECAQA